MTLRDLHDFQDVMFRAYVRDVMFVAALPYHLAQEMRRNPASGGNWEPPRAGQHHDARWLR